MSKRSFSGRGVALAVALSATLAATPSLAFDSFLVGPRAMGMGGANVASVSDTTAQYYNPAAFGFFGCKDKNGERLTCDNNNLGRKDWGVDVNASGGYRMNGDMGEYVDDLADIDIDQLNEYGIDPSNDSDLRDLINLVKGLEGLDKPGNAITADVNGGIGIRFGHFAIGGRGFFQASGVVANLDTERLGFEIDKADLVQDINTVPIDGYQADDSSTTYLVFTNEQADQLITALGVDGAEETVKRLDFIAAQEDLASVDVQEAVNTLETLLATSNSGVSSNSLNDNRTTILLQGFALGEIPISYGYAINDHWSIGANLKLMQGRVYGNQIVVFDEGSDDVIAETDEKYKDTTTFGVDLGVMGRYRFFNFGIVGRNLNSPKFDGFTDEILLSTGGDPVVLDVDDVTIDPQFTAGVAFIPFETLTIEADYDLTENETVLTGYDNQRLSFGLEWDAFRTLALRAGAYKNLAEDDIDWVYTAGLGLNLWATRLDLAGAFSTDKIEYDGDEIPQEIRVAAQLAVDF